MITINQLKMKNALTFIYHSSILQFFDDIHPDFSGRLLQHIHCRKCLEQEPNLNSKKKIHLIECDY